jgi:hypothetical protein
MTIIAATLLQVKLDDVFEVNLTDNTFHQLDELGLIFPVQVAHCLSVDVVHCL